MNDEYPAKETLARELLRAVEKHGIRQTAAELQKGSEMPILHPREKLIREAERDFREFLSGWFKKFQDLTAFESIQVLQNILGDEILSICKYGIRIERHGDTETPGGLSKE